MAGSHFKDLVVWKKAIDLVTEVYKITGTFPKEELFSLTNQIRRAAISVPSNIAEGQQRSAAREFIHFLNIAKGSLGELETQIIICSRLDYLDHEKTETLTAKCNEIGRMLNGLINNIQSASAGHKN